MSVPTISPRQLAELCQGGTIDLLDVRTPVEFREVHVEHARNVPLDRLDPVAVMQSRSGNGEPLYVICRSGGRGRQACEQFLAAGFPNVVNVEGGTLACVEAGLPVVRGKKMISLERQVRMAAGLLVLLGVLLGWLVYPAFFGLSAFVGAGLVFAGITDTCGMGLLLARMPWNQVKDAPAACCAAKEVRS
ncbi:MAG: rhodanese-like domain-containing protein [Gemmataceae bacterium]|nr:rhodanese-like domain-containing protein [Gemmataceae bacterium]